MRKFLVLTGVCVALVVLWGGYVLAQTPGGDPKPTFLAPTLGLYVNGWPCFTVSYPKEGWVIQPSNRSQSFRVSVPKGGDLYPLPEVGIYEFLGPADVSTLGEVYVAMGRRTGAKVLYSKPLKLQDGTLAHEAEIEWTITLAHTINAFLVAANKGGLWILIAVADEKGPTREELKNIAYSLKFMPGRDEPVQVPPDVREFLNKWNRDMESGDVARIMSNYSDQFNFHGFSKANMEEWVGDAPDGPVKMGLASMETTVTVFEAQGDKAYLSGFSVGETKSGAQLPSFPLGNMQIIKEIGQWKLYGDRK